MSDEFILNISADFCASKIQSALSALPDDGTPVVVRFAPGVYRAKLVLARRNTTLEGAGADRTKIIWDDAAFTILEDGAKRGTFRTATLRTDGEDITLRGLTIENAAAPRETAGQAIALYADGDRFLCEDCVLLGAQDTLFTAPLPPKEIEKNGFIGPKQFAPRIPQRHIYRRCRIVGDIDFIFGGAAARFEDCDIVSIDGRADRSMPSPGYICAPSTPRGQKTGYVFSRCRFSGEGVPRESVFLARPWREYAKAVFLHCILGEHIAPAGFDDWGKTHAHDTVFFAECGSLGAGAAGQRAPFARQIEDESANDGEGFPSL